MESPQKLLVIDIPNHPEFPLLGVYSKKTKTQTQKDTRTSVFLAMLFTIVKIWKQSKCSSIDECYPDTENFEMKFYHLGQHGWSWRVLR